jgi:polyphosphate kinase
MLIPTDYFLPTNRNLLKSPRRPLIDRDLSWLTFNERVLHEARTRENPLLERLKFLIISHTNLDEFFMIRFASLMRFLKSMTRKKNSVSSTHLFKLKHEILRSLHPFTVKQVETLELLTHSLAEWGIQIQPALKPGNRLHRAAKKFFTQTLLPSLAKAERFDPKHLKSLPNMQFALLLSNQTWVKLPNVPLGFTWHDSQTQTFCYLSLETLIQHFLAPGHPFPVPSAWGWVRLTRDCDFSQFIEEEDTASIPDVVKSKVKLRDMGTPVRLQYSGDIPADLLRKFPQVLQLSSSQVFLTPQLITLPGLWKVLTDLPKNFSLNQRVSLPPLQPAQFGYFSEAETLFARIQTRDVLLHHPYDDFGNFLKLIQLACQDPKVSRIYITIYRTDVSSPLLSALKSAAKSKDVRVLIELRARFDEMNNISLSEELIQAGIRVYFGFGRLKLHAKLSLIGRIEQGVEKRYAHLSTGNYNSTTARIYEDFGILTCHRDLCKDVQVFFDRICTGALPGRFKKLISAPMNLHKKLIQLIHQEIRASQRGGKARIFAKVNALVDAQIISHLYQASQAGVAVDLVVRGACSLIPGVKGLSENIRVISLVDRFLEHSRIYYFGHSQEMYLSSADWMPRNFFSRLEIAFPVLDPSIFDYIAQIVIPAYLMDTSKARELTPQGSWKRRTALPKSVGSPQMKALMKAFESPQIRTQLFFEKLSATHYLHTPLERDGT